jgi:AraC-like DNA-binding protein
MFDLSKDEALSLGFSVHSELGDTLQDMHYELEIGFVASGRMARQYEGWEKELGPGEMWFCGPWEPHGYRVVDAPCIVGVFVVWPPLLARQSMEENPFYDWLAPFSEPPPRRPQVSRQDRPAVLAVASRLRQLPATDAPQRPVWLRLCLLELMLTARRGWHGSASQGRRSADPYAGITPALRMVFESRSYVAVNRAARACGMSRNSFSSRFRAAMGIGFADFALRHRLKGAALQLVGSEAPVKRLAYDWGFTDSAHFHRCFVRHYGCTPSDYRRRAATRPLPR